MLARKFNLNINAIGFASLFGVLSLSTSLFAADRTTFFLPLAADAMPGPIPPGAVFADQAFGETASNGWKAYLQLWKAHHATPSNTSIRTYLGLPLKDELSFASKRGRSAPSWMNWAPGSYQQIDTPHFTVYSHADEAANQRIAEDLERCYWVWTQMFFPMWEANLQVESTLSGLQQQDVGEFLSVKNPRITIRRKLRVVLFRDAAEYQQTLAPEIPGIERSTGFYNDDKQTTFLYASGNDDISTRRHELVHQLFREATRSTLGRRKPAEDAGFWIIEGIAGYFESLRMQGALGTVGGWDSSRLQFARYRVLVHQDMMPISELRADGRLAAQQRQDIARWYAHAIAQTHHLLDSGEVKQRIAVYQLLNQRYAAKAKIAGGSIDPGIEQRLQRFLSIDDTVIKANPAQQPLNELCLAACQVSSDAVNQIPPSSSLNWLDLTRLPVVNDDVRRLVPDPGKLEQLTLEMTKVDAGLGEWLAGATALRELDLSHTPMDDAVLKSVVSATNLEVLWMTGTKISDRSIDVIAAMPKLQMVNVQQSEISPAGVARLQAARPNLKIN
ncbi:MAG: DUF1570 domain-containing protein [Pirellulaceae bacterium]